MSTRIGLISDPHANPEPVAEALDIFRREGVTEILCAGDIGGYGERLDETIALLQQHQVTAIRGNHEEWALLQESFPGSEATRDYFTSLPEHFSLTIEGTRLYMVHAEPPDKRVKGLRLFDKEGKVMPEVMAEWHERLEGFDHDVLILGHTHQVFDLMLGNVLVINPGSSSYNHSCAILTLPQKWVQWFALSGRPIEKVWSWGTHEVSPRGHRH
jgi:putative phosphoesterase